MSILFIYFSKMFYEELEVLCRKGKISPTKLANELDIAPATVTKWKNGSQPTADRILKIAKYFGVTTDQLLGRATEDPDLPEDEMLLLKNYRKTDERGKKRIQRTAEDEAQETEPASQESAS